MRFPVLSSVLLFVSSTACAPEELGREAIEITGYLDAERVTWTYVDDHSQAAARDGATPPDTAVFLTNLTAGTRAEARASSTGGFTVSVPALDGDRLVLRWDGGAGDEISAHDVNTDRVPFPLAVTAAATADANYEGTAMVELAFPTPLLDGHVWAVNRSLSQGANRLHVFDEGHLHGGRIHGVVGHQLVLYWVPVDGSESLPLELLILDPNR